ncbi:MULTISPECIES: enoyl-CoA hydratase/isomerase family protein [unclassified Caballeronia]|uniref:enoyl-CoA hydratase/isomerase family protein n=1 Tax=unclassified Caballeronia TaxID=2646786 RepID=UPI00285B088B|nr:MULTISPECIES: enoyl-CoA hydratase/isomerase family protein [unclassified Caballeronia]MDR5777319.1 enoyl-CoA hydratase/isomerase family protein [Caballeronia sp. LZ002]MDR5852749.1 enoyl-CoA hydratase/isomerase family protein [Caballeronia sp. LZ003]
MDFPSYRSLTFRRDGRVLHVTLNRPDTLNAFVNEMHDEFQNFTARVGDDDETDVVVLSGAGRAFSAGGDFDEIQRGIDDPARFYRTIPHMKRIVNNLLDVPQPVIAKINGPAMGLGATIALLCDITFAANHAKIGDPHVKVGYVAGDGGAAIWPHLVGYARAKQFLFTGDPLTGEEAAKIGLVNFAYPAEELDSAVEAFAQKLVNTPRFALRWTKATVNIGLKQAAAAVLDAGAAYEALSSRTRDHAEAVAAARAKREPSFTGD